MEKLLHLFSLFSLVFMANCSTVDVEQAKKVAPELPRDAVFAVNGKMYRTGLVIPKDTKKIKFQSVAVEYGLPDEFDWRAKVQLSPIENQGSCGSCWAFSTAATFQDVKRIFGEKDDLSEQYLLSCANPAEWSCNGGFFAHDAHMSPRGAVSAAEYPYTGTDSTCRTDVNYQWRLSSWAYVSENPTVDQIKSTIYKYGPVSVGVAADNAFSSYSGGIFQGSGSTQLNHAVNIVGWGKGYWIMRNSWGASWGEGGYMRIKWGANGIGAWLNYVVYNQNPDPGPDPDPNPDPDPEPPPPCDPQPYADTGFGEIVKVRLNTVINLGTRPRPGTRYFWTAEPAFDNGAVPQQPQIKYRPRVTKKLTVHAVTRCGEAQDSVMIEVLAPYRAEIKPEVEY